VFQSLVDDDLVHQEKIGSSNFFWSFPSEHAVKLLNEIARAQELDQDLASTERQLEESLKGKDDSVRDSATVSTGHRADRAQYSTCPSGWLVCLGQFGVNSTLVPTVFLSARLSVYP
jgi:Mnd1 HTH domain